MFREIHRLKGFAHFSVLAVPIDFFLPVQMDRVVGLARFALGDGVPVGEVVGKQSSCDRVGNPEYELTVLVVGDFGFIHEESGNGNRLGLVEVGTSDVFTAHTHSKIPLRNKHHPVRIRLIEGFVGLSHSNQLALI